MKHEAIEKNVGLLGVLTAIAISFGGLAEIVPLYFSGQVTEPAPGVEPYAALPWFWSLSGHPCRKSGLRPTLGR